MNELTSAQMEAIKNAAALHPEYTMEPFDALYGLDWFDAICVLSEVSGGCNMYMPSTRKIFAKCIEVEARKDLETMKSEKRIYALLAKKYGYTEQHMARILKAMDH